MRCAFVYSAAGIFKLQYCTSEEISPVSLLVWSCVVVRYDARSRCTSCAYSVSMQCGCLVVWFHWSRLVTRVFTSSVFVIRLFSFKFIFGFCVMLCWIPCYCLFTSKFAPIIYKSLTTKKSCFILTGIAIWFTFSGNGHFCITILFFVERKLFNHDDVTFVKVRTYQICFLRSGEQDEKARVSLQH